MFRRSSLFAREFRLPSCLQSGGDRFATIHQPESWKFNGCRCSGTIRKRYGFFSAVPFENLNIPATLHNNAKCSIRTVVVSAVLPCRVASRASRCTTGLVAEAAGNNHSTPFCNFVTSSADNFHVLLTSSPVRSGGRCLIAALLLHQENRRRAQRSSLIGLRRIGSI